MNSVWDWDKVNDRIVAYLPTITREDIQKVKEMIDANPPGKIILYITKEQCKEVEELGFSEEAKMSGFFQGEDTFIYTKYYKADRAKSKSQDKNKSNLAIVQRDEKDLTKININYGIEKLEERDLPQLASVFKTVFPVYPTNIFDPAYLKKARDTEYTFMVAKDNSGKIVGAASAMDSGFGSAEITDCAVLPDYRGENILQGIILALEDELVGNGINFAYSITRANSVGMNMTVKRLGYNYEGTLINNCIISTGFEDMNIWTKHLVNR
ncbi:putative beta-lysine N-acetyltransferase [Evansella sp. AB-rgal1]|uniref:putative beta-lysine N-acetyltransferase n=1 Tax=Evansella sp. AB-rgal1 TaxID=3242696 RepID=UPI00359D0745